MTDYQTYMESEAWVATRHCYRQSNRPQRCLGCGHRRTHLHHLTYEHLGEEHLEDLVPLCEVHHIEVHRYADAHPLLSLCDATVSWLEGRAAQGIPTGHIAGRTEFTYPFVGRRDDEWGDDAGMMVDAMTGLSSVVNQWEHDRRRA